MLVKPTSRLANHPTFTAGVEKGVRGRHERETASKSGGVEGCNVETARGLLALALKFRDGVALPVCFEASKR